MIDYLKRTKQIYPPYIAERFGVDVTEVISEYINQHKHARFHNNMLHDHIPEQHWYYEVCDTPYKRGQFHPDKTIQNYWLNNQRNDQHYSVFKHDRGWTQNVKSTGSVSCSNTMISTDLFWLELDRKDHEGNANFYKAIQDALTIRRRITDIEPTAKVWVFTSGNHSAHIGIDTRVFGRPVTDQSFTYAWANLAHKLAQDVRFNNGICDPRKHDDFDKVRTAFQLEYGNVVADKHTIMQALENIDPNIYRTNSLIRQPYSIHPTGKHKKSLVDADGNFDYSPKHLILDSKPNPKLMSLWIDSFKRPEKKAKRSTKNYDQDYIIETFSKYVEGFDPDRADSNGWVKAYNPFYVDTNPDFAINIESGYVHDFGDSTYSLTFDEFLLKLRQTTNK